MLFALTNRVNYNYNFIILYIGMVIYKNCKDKYLYIEIEQILTIYIIYNFFLTNTYYSIWPPL